MTDIPGSVIRTIRHAMVLNMRDAFTRHGEDGLPNVDLYASIVQSLQWLIETNADAALYLIQRGLSEATADGGPTLESASRCLRHSLTQGGKMTPEHAQRFVTAALLAA